MVMDNINIKMEIYIKEIGYKIVNVITIANLCLLLGLYMKGESKMENIKEKEN